MIFHKRFACFKHIYLKTKSRCWSFTAFAIFHLLFQLLCHLLYFTLSTTSYSHHCQLHCVLIATIVKMSTTQMKSKPKTDNNYVKMIKAYIVYTAEEVILMVCIIFTRCSCWCWFIQLCDRKMLMGVNCVAFLVCQFTLSLQWLDRKIQCGSVKNFADNYGMSLGDACYTKSLL